MIAKAHETEPFRALFLINNDAVCRIYPNYWATKEDFDWAIKALDDACAYVTETMGE